LDAKGREWYWQTLIIDDFGQFGDSLDLPASVAEGEYRIMVRSLVKERSRENRMEIELEGASFIVRKPEKSPFTITLRPTERIQRTDDTVNVVMHYSSPGGIEVGMPVVVRWYETGMLAFPNPAESGDRAVFYPGSKRILLHADTVKFSPSGQMNLLYTRGISSTFGYLVVEASASRGDNGEAVTSTAFVQMSAHDIYLHTGLSKIEVEKGKQVELNYFILPLFMPVRVKEVQVRIFRDSVVVLDKILNPDSLNCGKFRFRPAQRGAYRAELSVRDSYSKKVVAHEDFYIYDRLGENWTKNILKIRADKKVYTRNDTARLTAISNISSPRILLTSEGQGVHHFEVRRLAKGKAEFQVPIAKLSHGASLSFTYSGRRVLIQRDYSLNILDSINVPMVELTGKRLLKPGEMFVGKVKVTDMRGRPLPASFSLTLREHGAPVSAGRMAKEEKYPYRYLRSGLHKGIRNIPFRKENPKVLTLRNRFYASDLLFRELEPNVGWHDYENTLEESDIDFFEVDHSDRSEALSETDRIKRALNESESFCTPTGIYEGMTDHIWLPGVKTNDSGEALLELDIPDIYNAWELVLVGTTADGIFQFQEKITIERDLLVQLSSSKSFIAGDTAFIASKICNRTNRSHFYW
jgi:hypothetical protein